MLFLLKTSKGAGKEVFSQNKLFPNLCCLRWTLNKNKIYFVNKFILQEPLDIIQVKELLSIFI